MCCLSGLMWIINVMKQHSGTIKATWLCRRWAGKSNQHDIYNSVAPKCSAAYLYCHLKLFRLGKKDFNVAYPCFLQLCLHRLFAPRKTFTLDASKLAGLALWKDEWIICLWVKGYRNTDGIERQTWRQRILQALVDMTEMCSSLLASIWDFRWSREVKVSWYI